MQQSEKRTKTSTTVPATAEQTEIAEPTAVSEQTEMISNETQTAHDFLSASVETPAPEILMIGERRQGERRSSESRRSGVRGVWEDRRLFDQRHREYSIFGKRMDGADDNNEANPLHLPDVPLAEIISPAEIRILKEQQVELEETQKTERKDDL